MKRKLLELKSDPIAAEFVPTADLTAHDLSPMRSTQFEFAAKEARVNMRLPGDLLAAVKIAASKAGVPYQRFIRRALEEALRR